MPTGVVRGVTRYKNWVPWEWDFVVSARAFLLQENFYGFQISGVENSRRSFYILVYIHKLHSRFERFLSPGHYTAFCIATVLILNLGLNGESISA